MAGFRQIISGPGFTPLPNFLWDAAQHPSETETGPHWQQGVTWIERCGGGGTLYDECLAVQGGTPAAQGSMASNVNQTSRGATAFTVQAEFDCSPVGQDIQQDKAEEALSKMEAYLVTRAFWTGTAGYTGTPPGTGQTTVWPHLASATTLDDPQGIRLQTAASPAITGGSGNDDPAVMLGRLESSLASCYGGQGVIHIPYSALPTFTSRMLILPETPNGPLRTLAGNLVVPGVGYTGSSPAGAAPAEGTTWIYATGAVFGFRSGVYVREFPGTFDRAENTVRMIASRTYLFGFECCHLAALTTLGVPV